MREILFEGLLSEPLRNGVSYPTKLRSSGIPMVNMKEAFAYDVICDQKCELVPLTELQQERFLLQEGDLLFVRQSLKYEGAGRCVYVGAGSGPRTWEGHLIRARLDSCIAEPRFYYYYFRSPMGWRNMESIIQQVAAAGIRGSDLCRLSVPHPSLRTQRAVVAVLGALDDKIAANERILEIADSLCAAMLEEILSNGVQLPFTPLGAIADVNARSVKPSLGERLRYIDISSVGVGRLEWPELISWEDAPGRARRGAEVGDTIWSTVRPNRRSHALILDDEKDLVTSTGFAVLTPTKVGPAFLYECTKRDEFVHYLESVAEGSAYPAVRSNRFLEASIPMPNPDRLERFEAVAFAVRNRAHNACRESRTLTALRDTLLPQLVSGKLRLRDAERIVEDAV